MRSRFGLGALGACILLLGTLAAPSGAATSAAGVEFSHVKVTASHLHGQSAISMTITNDSKNVISLFSISSPAAKSGMIDYDTNMCQGNHSMMQLQNILIYAGHSQKLGYQYQGAMLRHTTQKIVAGETIPVVITWTDFRTPHTVTLEAKVVTPPRHLNFGMSGMSGMNM